MQNMNTQNQTTAAGAAEAIAREYAIRLRDEIFTPLLICAAKPTEEEFLFSVTRAVIEAHAAIQRGDGQSCDTCGKLFPKLPDDLPGGIREEILRVCTCSACLEAKLTPPAEQRGDGQTALTAEINRMQEVASAIVKKHADDDEHNQYARGHYVGMVKAYQNVLAAIANERLETPPSAQPAAKPAETSGATPRTDAFWQDFWSRFPMEENRLGLSQRLFLDSKLKELERELAAEKRSHEATDKIGWELRAELAAVRKSAGAEAIARDRAERDAELAERDRELQIQTELANTWCARASQAEAKLAEREAELREWRTLCAWGGTPEIVHEWIKGQQSRIHACQDLEAKIAEQSAALDACKTAVELTHQILHDAPELNMSNYHHDEVADINFAVNNAHKVLSDALAQIEALAGKGGAK